MCLILCVRNIIRHIILIIFILPESKNMPSFMLHALTEPLHVSWECPFGKDNAQFVELCYELCEVHMYPFVNAHLSQKNYCTFVVDTM